MWTHPNKNVDKIIIIQGNVKLGTYIFCVLYFPIHVILNKISLLLQLKIEKIKSSIKKKLFHTIYI